LQPIIWAFLGASASCAGKEGLNNWFFMSKRSIYTQKFIQALLGNQNVVFIGDFVVCRIRANEVQLLTKKMYQNKLAYDQNKTPEARQKLKSQHKEAKKTLKTWCNE
jgi:hypothetical protein